MVWDKDKLVKIYTLDGLCPFPFGKNIDMPPFLSEFELPKYDKYFGTTDPQDHVQEFRPFSMEFMHNQIYLMHLFPRSLGGQSMEWFSHIALGIKMFDEIYNLFVQ